MDYLKRFTVDDTEFGVALMDNNNKDQIDEFFTLFEECFGKRPHLNKDWYNWYYCQNPFGECKNYLLFDINQEELIGAYGFAKLQYTVSMCTKAGVLGVNAMISKRYGRKGLFTRLMQIGLNFETENNFAFSFPNGFNNGSVKGHINADWLLKESLHFYEYSSKNEISNTRTVKKLDSKDLYNINFDLFNIGSNFYFNRNPEFLQWRYFDRPLKKYTILGNFDSDKVIDGFMVLGIYQNRDQQLVTQIIDYRAKNNYVLENLIREAIILKKDKINLIISDFSTDNLLFRKLGYKKSEENYKLMLYPSNNNYNFEVLLGDFDVV